MNGHSRKARIRDASAAARRRFFDAERASARLVELESALRAARDQLQRRLHELKAIRVENRDLKATAAHLQAENAKLRQELERVRAELDAARRQAKRQAAPFSKGPPKEHPRRPGRKPGRHYGRKAHRPQPPPEQIHETYDVPLPQHCPDCGGKVKPAEVAQQFQVELPREPIWRQFNIAIGTCEDCGQRIQGRHALQTSDALGAAAVQLGPDAQAGIVLLNKILGLSYGKIADLYRDLLGIQVSRGAAAQVVLRAARRCEDQRLDSQIEDALRHSKSCVVDETGWRIGGRPAWLHVLVGEKATCYKIEPRRSADVAASVLGWDYSGTLIHDGLSAYGRFLHATHQQCAGHMMRRLRELLRTAIGGSGDFPQRVLGLFGGALGVRDLYSSKKISRDAMSSAYPELTAELQHLVERPRQNAANRRLAKHLRNHLREWFQFLLDPSIDATNYRAEQSLRPAVVNRKVWGGNRTRPGSRAQATLMSVLRTARQHGMNLLDVCHRLFCGTPVAITHPP